MFLLGIFLEQLSLCFLKKNIKNFKINTSSQISQIKRSKTLMGEKNKEFSSNQWSRKQKKDFLSFSNDHTWQEIRHFPHFMSFYLITFLLSKIVYIFLFIYFHHSWRIRKIFQVQILVFVLLEFFFFYIIEDEPQRSLM